MIDKRFSVIANKYISPTFDVRLENHGIPKLLFFFVG